MSEAERSQYGQKALERALKLFTQETFLAEHREVYDKLLMNKLTLFKHQDY